MCQDSHAHNVQITMTTATCRYQQVADKAGVDMIGIDAQSGRKAILHGRSMDSYMQDLLGRKVILGIIRKPPSAGYVTPLFMAIKAVIGELNTTTVGSTSGPNTPSQNKAAGSRKRSLFSD